jgi:ATP-dependent exoDNAse (exonuclease V) beta subunit
MSDVRAVPDTAQRERALEPGVSFIVQAPAGSGKTELLIQRFLALLARVERPEEIAAITFTIKAAAEMRGRIFQALRAARQGERPQSVHEARTWDLARAALERNDALGWKLEESADRLRVQTIDALCASLTRQMPVLSRFGAQPESLEDATELYAEAAHNLVLRLEESGEVANDVARLLGHVDNNAAEAQRLIADMLMRRDHWIRTLREGVDRERLDAALNEMRIAAVARTKALWPADVPKPELGTIGWLALSRQLLTTTGQKTWRAKDGLAQRLSGNEVLREALEALQDVPADDYSDRQYDALEAIVRLAPHAISELHYVFSMRHQCDFVEVAQGALRALETDEGPTDLLLALDYRIRHVLVDEFQDTSFTQFDLLVRLTSGWEPGDGRTLFLVGDPMQSIYRFREAEVGLFLKAWTEGIGTVSLEPLTLSANFRSQAGIVDWVNDTFERLMPQQEDMHSGAVKYAHSQPVHEHEGVAVQVHPFFDGDLQAEAATVARVAREALAMGTVAILVRGRSHLLEIMPKLREAKLPFRAIEIELLGHRPVVQDLLALARAISHLGDRTAWLAVLRAPWCGLALADLHAIAAQPESSTIWEGFNEESREISADGLARSQLVRDVLGRAMAQRSRSSLRVAVERAWLALGGPACAENDTDLEDAEIFLDHLEGSEVAGAIPDMAVFEESLARLYALPDLSAPDSLQVMTIHKAKGLEFDTVIVPGLGSGTGRDDRKLFMWMETPARQLLLAPINPTGTKGDDIYEYIRCIDKEKADHENGRLLYVAATRARRRLHLLGDTKLDEDAHVRAPTKGSLLHKLWPAVNAQFVAPGERRIAVAKPAVAPEKQSQLRRLLPGSLRFAAPPAASWNAPRERPPFESIEFSWVGDTARRVGSVVHRWLQRIADEKANDWTKKRVERERGAIRRELVARGVVQADLERAADRVAAAISATLDDKRGRWILGPQRSARNEYRLTTTANGERRMLVIDRVFEDDVGDTWIVDYKTSTHEGSDPEAFLASEQERYREQLEGYVVALGNPKARRGLYFPLLKGWREW